MSKQIELKVNNFSGGVSDSNRKISATEFSVSKHFDIFSDPFKLIPYRSLEVDDTSSTAHDMKQYAVRDFLYASASAKLYGLGQIGAGKTKIVLKADSTTSNWTLPASSEGNGAVQNGCFVEYKDHVWGFQGTNQVWKWGTLSGSPSITDSVSTVGVTITSVAQGIVSKDDNLYLPYNNKIGRVTSNGTYNDAVLTLPSNFKITSLTNYGNYLAIACAPISTYNGVSKVFLWNLTSTDVQETIDWGEGELRVLETIEGYIIGITDRYLNNATGAGRGSMIIQAYSGGVPQVLKEVFTQKLNGKTMPLSKAVKNNRLFFSAKIMTNTAGTEYDEGIWSFGRKNANYPWALALDIIDENVSTSGIQAFGTAANYFFIAHSADGSIDKTNDAATYAFTSIYESQILNMGDAGAKKKLLKIGLTTVPLPSGSSVTVKYKVNNDTSWTTVGTVSTADKISRDFINIESTGDNFASFDELKIRIESTGGAEITGYTVTALPLIVSED